MTEDVQFVSELSAGAVFVMGDIYYHMDSPSTVTVTSVSEDADGNVVTFEEGKMLLYEAVVFLRKSTWELDVPSSREVGYHVYDRTGGVPRV